MWVNIKGQEKLFLPITHWQYFIALERNLVRCSHYIEFCSDNNNAYSFELSKNKKGGWDLPRRLLFFTEIPCA